MKKISTLVVCTVVLTSFLFINHAHAQTGPIAKFELWDDSTNTLMEFDSVFFSITEESDILPQSEENGFNVYNRGDEPLVFTVSTSNPDFSGSYGTHTLQGEADQFSMVFRPSKTGLSTGVITITTNDPNHKEFLFNVKGYGLEPPVDASTEQFNLVVGTSVTKEMVVRNTTPNRAKFKIAVEASPALLPIIVSKGGLILDWRDEFILEAGESTTIDFLFDYTAPNNHPEEFNIPVRVTCEPFHFAATVLSPLYIYKTFIINGEFPFATIGAPNSIHVEVPIATVTPIDSNSSSFTITNFGNKDFNYSINTDSVHSEMGGVRLYSTGFEELTPGLLHGQGGWSAKNGSRYEPDGMQPWTIDNSNPFRGSQHFRCTSDGGGRLEALAQLPLDFVTCTNDVSIADMMVDVELGATWNIVAHASKGNSTVLAIAPNGQLSTMMIINGSDEQIPIPGSLPSGYFNLRFTVKRSTKEFSISVNSEVIYSGIGLAIDITTITIVSYMEAPGVTLDIDDVRIIDGDQVTPLLSVFPKTGSIPPLGSHTIEILVDSRNINAGTYIETLAINSNDSLQPVIPVPVTVVVNENVLPILTGPFDNSTMIAGETKSFTFSATDEDDSDVSFIGYFSGDLNPVVTSGNGFRTYTIETNPIEEGSYSEGVIIARDGRGGITSRAWSVTVRPPLSYFMLTNFKTGSEIRTVTDTVTLDIAHPEFDQQTIEIKPYAFGDTDDFRAGIKFVLNGVQINKDKTRPYYLDHWQLPKLSEGYHTLTAISYYINSLGDETNLTVDKTIVHVINSAKITSYQIVNKDGVKVMDLVDGSVIDLSKTGSDINIIAKESIRSVRSVKFVLNNVTARIDNGSPYALGGNPIGGDTFWKARPGTYTLSATPYLKYFAWGPKGKTLTVNFKVVNGTAPAKQTEPIARLASSANEEQVKGEEALNSEDVLSLYPVPVIDELHIELHESVKGNVVLNIMNAQGQSVHSKSGVADEFRKYSVSTLQLGMSHGIYFVIVNQGNGKRLVGKFIKE